MVAATQLIGSIPSDATSRDHSSGKQALSQAAALPWRLAGARIEIMLVTSRRRRQWILPKGWAERRERHCDAAAREALEEAGLTGSISMHEFGRYRYVKTTSRGTFPCQVSVFPLRVIHVADRWKEQGQRARRWMESPEAIAAVNEPELRKLIETFFAAGARRSGHVYAAR